MPTAQALRINDFNIVQNLRANDETAFNDVVRQYSKKLLNIIFSIIKDEDQAYDLLQETMIKLYKNINQFKGNSSLITWITRIAINLSLDYVKKNKKCMLFCQENEEERHYNDNVVFSNNKKNNPEDIAIDDFNHKKINDVINKMDQVHQLTLRLKYFDNFTTKEISFIMGVPEGTVRSRLYYSRGYLRRELENLYKAQKN